MSEKHSGIPTGAGRIPPSVLRDWQLTPAAKVLYATLTTYAGEDGGCSPSNESLTADMGMTSSYVSLLLSQLQERGHIRKEITSSYKGRRRKIVLLAEHGEIQPDGQAKS